MRLEPGVRSLKNGKYMVCFTVDFFYLKTGSFLLACSLSVTL